MIDSWCIYLLSMWLIDVSCCRLVGCDLVHLLSHGMRLPAAKVYVTGLWVGGLPLLGIPNC
jgi:hypothetical protein